MAGYSRKTLAAKLGLAALNGGARGVAVGAPESLVRQVRAECPGTSLESVASLSKISRMRAAAFLWCFCSLEKDLQEALPVLRNALAEDGMIWISWPKKTSWKLLGLNPSGAITEDAIRRHAFPHGLVDVKVCAVDEIWSGLKLMVRRENRKAVKAM